MQAMLGMVKLEVKALQAVYEGSRTSKRLPRGRAT